MKLYCVLLHHNVFLPELQCSVFSVCLVMFCRQAIHQDSGAPWLKLELQYAQLLQSPLLMSRKDLSEVERDWGQLTQEWRGQCACLQSRYSVLRVRLVVVLQHEGLITIIYYKQARMT